MSAPDLSLPAQYDVVRLTMPWMGLPVGTEGTLIEDYEDGWFLMEVVDGDGKTVAMPEVRAEAFTVTHKHAS